MNIAITLLKQKEYNIRYNLCNAANTCKDALENGADTVLLPEFFNLGLSSTNNNQLIQKSTQLMNRSYNKFYYPLMRYMLRRYLIHKNYIATDIKSYLNEITENIQSYNKKYIIGSIPLKEGKSIYNTGFIIDSKGDILFKQRKLHPYDYEHHLIDGYNKLDTIKMKGFNTAITICWDSLEGEMENAINKGAQLILSPTLFTTFAATLKYSHHRAQELKNHIYFACSTIIPQGNNNKISGGAFITGPDINSTKHTEGFMIKKLDINKLTKPDHKIKKIILDYTNNPHFENYASINEAYINRTLTYKTIMDHEKQQ